MLRCNPVVNLTLIDLPCLTKVAVEGQPDSIVQEFFYIVIFFIRLEENDVDAEMRRLRLELKQTMDMYSTTCKEAISAKQKNDVEAEMRRLRLELKQTMDMYGTACKEVISAKQKNLNYCDNGVDR